VSRIVIVMLIYSYYRHKRTDRRQSLYILSYGDNLCFASNSDFLLLSKFYEDSRGWNGEESKHFETLVLSSPRKAYYYFAIEFCQ
jgi:hypothetical protein